MAVAAGVVVGASLPMHFTKCCVATSTSRRSTVAGIFRNCGIRSSGRARLRQREQAWPPVRSSAAVQSSGQVLTEAPAEEFLAQDRPEAWKLFVENVSGEWDGYGADFNFLGEPSELPSQVVPDAYRDWGLEVHDWQTMCPTLGQDESRSLSYRVIRLLPTVGCEADAATSYCTEEREFETALSYSFHTNGSYTAVWPGKGVVKNSVDPGKTEKTVVREVKSKNEWEIEHCLVNEDGGSQKSRARILQQFRADADTAPQLKTITVYIEHWEGPFNNGESLGGCSTSGSGFATTAALELADLAGSWRANTLVAQDVPSPKLLTAEASVDVERSELAGQIVALPKNIWSCVKSSEDGVSYIAEAGWLVDLNHSIVSNLEFLPSGDFKASSIRIEQRR